MWVWIWEPERHRRPDLVIFFSIRTHLACLFLLAVVSSGLRRNGSSSQVINQGQDFPEELPRHGNLGQLERDVPAMFALKAEMPGDCSGSTTAENTVSNFRLLYPQQQTLIG